MAELIAGWDLGGAHLKLALATSEGTLRAVRQEPCALWQGLDRLDQALDRIWPEVAEVTHHAVTMTGELVDLFDSRPAGVTALLGKMTARVSGGLSVYGGAAGFLTPQEAGRRPQCVASANWHASAAFVARRVPEALFLDLGSTTADLVPLHDGQIAALGVSDHERLALEELVYSGVTRTPVMALARSVPFAGTRQALMAEHFATTADLHRITGRLPEHADQHSTADGAPKTPEASLRRLARMLGRDLEDGSAAAWQRLARHLTGRQLQSLERAAERILSRDLLDDAAPLVGAGIGRFLLADLAARLARPYRDFATLVDGPDEVREHAARSAPATALALLAAEPHVR